MDPNPPAGWMTDPDDPSRLRWWDGEGWTVHRTRAVPSSAARGWRPGPKLIGVAVGVVVVALGVAARSGFGGFLSTVGLAALVIAIVGLVRGGVAALGLRGKPAAAALLAGGIVVLLLGGGVNAATTGTSADVQPFVSSAESPSAAPDPTAVPLVHTTVTEQQVIPFGAVTIEDATVAAGTSFVSTFGVDGVREVTYTVTMRDGVEVDREKVGEIVTIAPIDQVTTVGTMVEQRPPVSSNGCDPNYSGCVPIASDVDCAGGSGDGPAYANGPVTIIGQDIYDLDRDGDGVACDR